MQTTLKNKTIFTRDNLEVMRGIDSNTIDLIYLDPPFNKKKQFTAPIGTTAEGASFRDLFQEEDVKEEWLGLIAEKYPQIEQYIQAVGTIGHKSNKYYLCYMAVRLIEMHRILKPTGSLYLHCDQTMSHYLKLLLDCIFGEDNLRNEIVWYYRKFGRASNNFKKNHDTLLWYAKDATQVVYNPQYESFSPKTIKDKYKRKLVDGKWKQDKSVPMANIRTQDAVAMGNVWEVSFIHSQSKERIGYPTQKPLKLLKRIIQASTVEGDVVLDPFCGCATTCIASELLNRQWIGIDISTRAHELVLQRMEKAVFITNDDPKANNPNNPNNSKALGLYGKVIHRTDIPARTDDRKDSVTIDIRHTLYGAQEGMCKGCHIHFNFRNLTVDHIIPRSKGGGNNRDNLQLLCHNCNAIKGDRDMAYLSVRLKNIFGK